MGDCNCKHGSNGVKGVCAECEIPQLARNNYFTGKLLVERDFTDEQHYFIGKERRHNQQLHGWGVVCGLKVKPHPNPACQDRFVLVEPGVAIDCCGREVLVRHEDCLDFESRFLEQWRHQNGPAAEPDSKPHEIQVCISYKECATEDVPALFEDCGGNAGSSQPNRILESYELDVLIDPPRSTADPGGVELAWNHTLNFADAVKVARHDDTKRLYVLTSTADTAVVYALDTVNESILIPPKTLAGTAGLDLAVSPAGDFVYLALQAAPPSTAPPQIVVLKAADLSQVNAVDIGTAADHTVRLTVVPGPDGRVLSIGQAAGVMIWPADINTGSTTGTAVASVASPLGIAVSPGGQFAYVTANGTNHVAAIDLSQATLPVTTFNVGTTPSALAVAKTTAGDTLAILDTAGTPTLFFMGMRPSPSSAVALGHVSGFANPPIDVQLSPGGRFAFVLEEDATGKVSVQATDEHAVELGTGNALGGAISVGAGAAHEILSADGSVLYVAYAGTSALPGAIAVVKIGATACEDLFRQTIEGCPGCDSGNCMVLATIPRYIFGSPVTEAQVDNLKDRRILARTSLLAEAVRCLLDQPAGGGQAGPQGPPGQNGSPGAEGPGIDQVSVTFVACDQPGAASISGVSPNRTLNLTIPGDCNKGLTGIQSVSWKNNGGQATFDTLRSPGLGIAFTGPVQAADLTGDSVFLLASQANGPLTLWPEVTIKVVAGNFAVIGDVTSVFNSGPDAAGHANGLFLVADDEAVRQIELIKAQKLRVLLKGDLIRDGTDKARAVDGDQLPPWLPARPTGDGIAGGNFESWFQLG